MQAHCFPAALYLVARSRLRDPGAGPTGQAPPPIRPLPAADRWGLGVSAPPLLAALSGSLSPCTPQINCTRGRGAGQAASWCSPAVAWWGRDSSPRPRRPLQTELKR